MKTMRRAILFMFMVAPIAVIAWVIAQSHRLDLKSAQAASIISSTPEFNSNRSLVKVSYSERFDDSTREHDRAYAWFTFKEQGFAAIVEAKAEFQYRSGDWHLRCFYYGHERNEKRVEITRDVPPENVLSR